MFKVSILPSVAMALFFLASPIHAQQAMEIAVPIGKSPGVSQIHSIIGVIDSVDDSQRIITIADSTDTYTVTITDNTKIWLDKSKANKANVTGSPSDCLPGRTVEVNFTETERASSVTAEWIKVETAE